ncbi:hypothetical protein HGRIS_001656 [Hohenbuehelia grisea]|uniref:Uncharacterized protein n=1 Tax=Hohenbuehelia grisea TaxID=104357 RepID=A0ABR3JI33_9AGAR
MIPEPAQASPSITVLVSAPTSTFTDDTSETPSSVTESPTNITVPVPTTSSSHPVASSLTTTTRQPTGHPRIQVILGSAFAAVVLLLTICVALYLLQRCRDKSPDAREPAPVSVPPESIPPTTHSYITRLLPSRCSAVNTSSTDARNDEKVLQCRESLSRQRTEMQAELAQLQRSASFLSNFPERGRSGLEGYAEGESIASSGSEPTSAEINRKIAWMMGRIAELETRIETPVPRSCTPPPIYASDGSDTGSVV